MENELHIPQAKLLRGLKTAARGLITGGGAFLLLVWLTLFALPVNNAWALTDVTNKYDFNDTGNNTCTIAGYRGSGGNIEIPSQLRYGGKDYTVKSIGVYAFASSTGLTSVTLAENTPVP